MNRDTVFSPSFGNRPSQLVGREMVLDRMLEGLQSTPGSKERAILILGQRGSGKTVLLWELADRARKLGCIVATPTIATEDMLERIVEKIQDAGAPFVKEKTSRIAGGSVGALGFSAGLQFSREVQETKSFQYKLTQLTRKLNEYGKTVLILVDEVQANSPQVRHLVAAYQELVGEGCDIAIAMAGLPGAISSTLNDHVLTFLNRARKYDLKPLPIADIQAFFTLAFAQLNISIATEDVKKAAAATQGSPYLLQLVGHHIALATPESGAINTDLVSRALEQSREEFEIDVCETTLAALSDRDIDFLKAMSADDGTSRVSDIAKRLDVTVDYAQKYRKRLIDAGVIEAARRGYVSFAVPYLGQHMKNR